MIPVALFAYARPDLLDRTLACLEHEAVPLLYIFSDGPRDERAREGVEAVRRRINRIRWCETVVVERSENLGLGRSILSGVGYVLKRHEALLVFEDDLICVPGTYRYLSAALEAYADIRSVMSVTGWTHPDLTPPGISDQPYFDGRSSSWLWGCWRRSWEGMQHSASRMIWDCRIKRIDPRAYGCDLYRLARYEIKGNTWAVRFMYNHIRQRALSLHPPHSLVEHVGVGEGASNHRAEKQEKWLAKWGNPPLRPCPPIPSKWPEPIEHPGQPARWQKKCGRYMPTSLPGRMLARLGIR